jgi:glucose-1-phosphate adenylyltransferase
MQTSTDILGMVLAGGEGRRLHPLTQERSKPAVPFGGQYRLIDFVLSNLVNSGLRKIVVLTQYLSHSLDRHMAQTWRLSPLLGNYVATVPAQMRTGPRWFSGSADAIFQNLNILGDEQPEYVAVFGADHIYRMDVRPMLEQHVATDAAVTVSGIPVPIEQAKAFGVIDSDDEGRIRTFLEKPAEPPPMPGDPTRAFASMATTSSPPRRSATWSRPTPRTRAPSTTSAATSSPGWSARGGPGSTTSAAIGSPARARPSAATGGTWAASTPTTRRAWT